MLPSYLPILLDALRILALAAAEDPARLLADVLRDVIISVTGAMTARALLAAAKRLWRRLRSWWTGRDE